jgi:hypothetical protein
VRCIDWFSKFHALAGVALLTACSAPAPTPAPPTARAGAGSAAATSPAAPAASLAITSAGKLPPPAAVRNWTELRLQAARRMVAANSSGTYMGTVPDVLLAIPVLEIELNADGSVRRIVVLRKPGQAPDTTQLAMDAVHRAAPFGNVSHLPKPWKFSETFLFDDQRRFKPRTLDN